MLVDELRALVKGAEVRGHIPAQPLIAISKGPSQAEEYAGLVVDLGDVLGKAMAARARSLDVYADTLVIAAPAALRISEPVLRVTIIARRIVVGAGARIVLDHSGTNPLIGLRIYAGSMEGDLAVASDRGGKTTDYDLSDLTAPRPAPAFANLAWSDGGPVTRKSAVPPGLLARGHALHATLAASFNLVAGLVARQDEDADVLALAHAILRWIGSWAGLQSDLAQISRLAEGLRAILPDYVGDQLVRPIPPLTAAKYLSLAKARKDLAKAIELDAHFLGQSTDMAEIARLFVKANLTRDDAEASLINSNMAALQSEADSIQSAIERAAKALRDRQLDQELAEIELHRVEAHDKIDKIVDATFQLAIGLVTLGVSIAAICMGVPADPTASAKKDIQGVEGLIDAMKKTQQNNPLGPNSVLMDLKNVLRLYALPVTFLFNNVKDHKDSISDLVKSALDIKKAASAILKNAKATGDFDEMVDDLGEATRNLAGSPSPLEARAAWDSLEATAVNALDVVINHAETVDSVKTAAADYKTAIQKVAIYGRLMAEQQARKDASLRALGTLALQKLAQVQKAAAYETLQQKLTDRDALNAHIRSEMAIRQEEAARAFFCACYGIRCAQYYETYSVPATIPGLPDSAAGLEALYSEFTGDVEATSGLRGRLMDFSRDILIRDATLLADFAAGKSVALTLPPDQPNLAHLSRIRMTGLEAWVEADGKLSQLIGIELISGTSFGDRFNGDFTRFTGESLRIPFEYQRGTVRLSWTGGAESVLPTPFSEWLITLRTPQSIPTPKALRLSVSGKALA